MIDAIQSIQKDSEEYPKLLVETPKPPEEIRMRGLFPATSHYLAIVGTRKATPYGREITRALVLGLQHTSTTIVSGLALGIDTVAHEAALDAHLPTIAVLGSGLSDTVLYPSQNRTLAKKIVEHGGCIISEYPDDMKATQWTFPERNRIVAGLSHGVIVIEAPQKSGALITARLGLDYNRDVGAVPGSLFSENSEGPHMLLKLGASFIRTSDDVREFLGIEVTNDSKKEDPAREQLNPSEQNIYELLSEPKTADEIIRQNNLPASQTQALMSMMEIRGNIKRIGGSYIRNA